jgi:cell wall-associated NlpC family hydrolase
VRPSVQARDSVGARRRRALIATTATIVFALAAVAASAEPGEIAARRAEVRQVLQQIQELDGELGHAVEAYNAANVRLEEIEHEREHNRRTLRIARRNLALEQRALARRLVAIYMSEDDLSGVGVILGATSLSDLLDRTDTVTAVERVDTRVAEEVKRFKKTIESQKRRLARAHERQGEIVAARAAAKAEIEGRLAERRRLVASIRSEIERLEAEERARQERLAREARERLARQRAAERAARLRAAEGASTSSGAYVPSAGLDGSAVGVVASTPDGSVVPESGRGGDVVAIAMQYLGVPYVWGGASPSGFDCSGFVMYVYAQVGVSLPHYTVSQYQLGIPVSSDQLQPGDLVFFNGLGHMGIYIGGGQFIHAPHTGDVVKISSLSDSWYAATYVGARRLL